MLRLVTYILSVDYRSWSSVAACFHRDEAMGTAVTAPTSFLGIDILEKIKQHERELAD